MHLLEQIVKSLGMALAGLVLLLFAYGFAQFVLENWMTPVQSGTEDLAYHMSGSGPSTVIALHGIAGSSRYFHGRLTPLFTQSQVIAFDLLGFGLSPKPRSTYSPAAHLTALRWTTHKITDARSYVLVGHSMGTLLAVDWATLHPEEVASLVLFSLPLFENQQQAREHLQNDSRMVRDLAQLNWYSEASCYFRALYRLPGMPEWFGVPKDIYEDGTRHTWNSLSGSMKEIVMADGYKEKLKALKIPVTIIQGEADSVAPLDHLQTVVASMQNARVVTVPKGGHHILLNDQEALHNLLCEGDLSRCDLSAAKK